MYGPIYPNPTRVYQGMTSLPRELEESLLKRSYADLIGFLHSRTPISGTDTVYTAVQFVAKEFSEKEIEKFLSRTPECTSSEGDPRPKKGPAPAAAKATGGEEDGSHKLGRMVKETRAKNNAHPQPIINEKVAASKAGGGLIAYNRGGRCWEVTLPNKKTIQWTADVFRDTTVDQIKKLMKDNK